MRDFINDKQAQIRAEHLAELCKDELEEVLNKYDASLRVFDGSDIEITCYCNDSTGNSHSGISYWDYGY